jgi:hypothetical protein
VKWRSPVELWPRGWLLLTAKGFGFARRSLSPSRSKQAKAKMAGIAERQRTLDLVPKGEPQEGADRIRLFFPSARAEPIEMDGPSQPAANDDADVVAAPIAFAL